MSMADMLADKWTGIGLAGGGKKAGKLIKGVLGSRVFAESVIDGKNRGLSDGQAMSLGLANAAAELLTEGIGLDEMLNLPEGWENAGFWKGALRGAIGEAGEEGLTNLANFIADYAIAGDKSEFKQNIEKHKQAGMDDSTALLEALKDAGISLGLDVIGGGLSGGAFGGYQGWKGKRAAAKTQQETENAANSAADAVDTDENAAAAVPKGFVDDGPGDWQEAAEAPAGQKPETESKTTAQEPRVAEAAGKQMVRPAIEAGPYGIIQNDIGGENHAQAGEDVLRGTEERDDGAGQRGGTAADEQREARRREAYQRSDTAAVQRRIKAENLERLGRLQRVSGQDLGLAIGTQTRELLELPRLEWDAELYETAKRLETETGMKVRYVTGTIGVRRKNGTERVRGMLDRESGQIVIDVCSPVVTASQIGDHELFHDKAFRVKQGGGSEARAQLLNQAAERIRTEYGQEHWSALFDTYCDALAEVYDTSDAERFCERVCEEILADAYAGINAFGVEAGKYQEVLKNHLVQEGLERNAADVQEREDIPAPGGDQRVYGDEDAPPLTGEESYDRSDFSEGEVSFSKADFADQVDDVMAGRFDRRNQVYVGKTPAILGDVGLDDTLPMLTTSKHLRLAAAPKNEHRHTHGLTVAQIKSIPDELRNPVMILDSLDHASNAVIVVTGMLDTDGEPVIVPIKADGSGRYNNMIVNANFVTSYYGRRNFENFLERIILDDGVLFVDKKKAAALSAKSNTQWFEKLSSHDFDIIIRETRAVVKNKDGNDTMFSVAGSEDEISQERIDAMVRRTDQIVKDQNAAEVKVHEAKVRNEQEREKRRMERNRERAREHAETRRRHLEEAKAKLAQEPEQNTPAPETKLTAQKPLFAKRNVRKAVLDTFHIPKGKRVEAGKVIEGYLDSILEKGYIEDGDTRNLMDKLIDLGVVEFEADEIMAEGRGWLKDQHIYVSDSLRQEFGEDWYWIQKKAFALGVWLTSDKKYASVDMWWQHMNKYMPGLVAAEEADRRTMLERLLWIAEEGKAEKMSLAEYTKMLADQERVSEADLLDSMAQNLGGILGQFARDSKMEIRMRQYTKNAMDRSWEKNKAYTKKAVDRQRLYRAADKAHYREHLQKMRNRRELSKLQERTLQTLQWLKRNQHRAPEELQDKIQEVLGDIDLYAIGAADELNWHPKYQMTWRDLAEVYKEAKARAARGEGNFFTDPELERIVARLDNRKIEDLDIGALNDLFNAAVAVRKAIFDADKLLSFEDGKRIGELYTEMTGEMEQARKPRKGSLLDKFFNIEQLTPMNVLRQMGGWRPDGAFAKMAGLLEQGEKDVRAYKVRANRILEPWLNAHADWVHKADGQGKDGIWIEVEVPELKDIGLDGGAVFGDTVKVRMTPMQRVHLLLESRNEDNLRHMAGGRTFADPELYSKGKRSEAFAQGITVKLAPETVRALVKDLSPEELELARLLDSYYNGMAPDEINRVSNILYGYNKAMGRRHAPIFTDQNFTKSEAGIFDQTAEGVGNLKARIHAGNPSYNISALDAFERNVDKTAQFVGMAIPARDWNSLLNWRAKESSMKDQITHEWGQDRLEYIDNLLVDLQGGTPVKNDVMQEEADKLLSNYISSVFGFNPSIVLKQAGSFPLAAAYLGAENMSWDMFRKAQRDRAFIAKYTQELAWRSMGYAMPETKTLKEKRSKIREGGKQAVSAALKYATFGKLSEQARDRFAEDAFGGGYITKMDEATVFKNALEKYIVANGGTRWLPPMPTARLAPRSWSRACIWWWRRLFLRWSPAPATPSWSPSP